jgi:hypothetical protein
MHYFYFGEYNNKLHVWDLETKQRVNTLTLEDAAFFLKVMTVPSNIVKVRCLNFGIYSHIKKI